MVARRHRNALNLARRYGGYGAEPDLLETVIMDEEFNKARVIRGMMAQGQGGIGWTDEQNLHFWFKRIGNARHLLGGPECLRNRAAELQGFAVAS
jgi:hypothetical protein